VCDDNVERMQLILTFHFLPSLNFATVAVKLSPHETASTISGGYDTLCVQCPMTVHAFSLAGLKR